MKPFTSDEHAVIADDGIYERVSRQDWDDLIAGLTAQNRLIVLDATKIT